MLLPTQLLPSTLGLKWGLSASECLELLSRRSIEANSGHMKLGLDLGDGLIEVDFFFEEPGNRDPIQWYDIFGHRHDWAQPNVWDGEGNLIVAAEEYDPERSGLFRIETVLFTSQSTWDDKAAEEGEDISVTRHRVRAEYQGKFEDLVAQYSAILGPPDYSGSHYIEVETVEAKTIPTLIWNPTFPIEQMESPLAYWTCAEGRLQVGQETPEMEESARSIVLACYRVAGK
jgi:hypothetical protein